LKYEDIDSSHSAESDYDHDLPSSAAMIAANTAITAMNLHNGGENASSQKNFPLGGMITGTLLDTRFQAVDATKTQPLPSPRSASTHYQPSSQDPAPGDKPSSNSKNPRRKPGARECMQISRRFGIGMIPQNYMEILLVSKLSYERD
jgi:hypothetical protein